MYDAEALPADVLLRETIRPAPEAKGLATRARGLSLRARLFAGLAAVVLVGAAGFGAKVLLTGGKVSTDNAYVGADAAQITPLVGGPVREVRVSDTQAVRRGDVLLTLDDTDARIALEAAQAEFGQAQRRVRGYLATDQSLGAQVAARAADQTRAIASVAAAPGRAQPAPTPARFARRCRRASEGRRQRAPPGCRSPSPHAPGQTPAG